LAKKLDTLLSEILVLLLEDEPLPQRAFDHALTGEWKDHRDCHINPDLMLIYRKPDDTSLELVRLGPPKPADAVGGSHRRDTVSAYGVQLIHPPHRGATLEVLGLGRVRRTRLAGRGATQANGDTPGVREHASGAGQSRAGLMPPRCSNAADDTRLAAR